MSSAQRPHHPICFASVERLLIGVKQGDVAGIDQMVEQCPQLMTCSGIVSVHVP